MEDQENAEASDEDADGSNKKAEACCNSTTTKHRLGTVKRQLWERHTGRWSCAGKRKYGARRRISSVGGAETLIFGPVLEGRGIGQRTGSPVIVS